MAQTYRERQLEPRRAIELYEQVLAENPDDDATLKALAELYEREGDDAGPRAHAAPPARARRAAAREPDGAPGKRADAPKEWPVAKRASG